MVNIFFLNWTFCDFKNIFSAPASHWNTHNHNYSQHLTFRYCGDGEAYTQLFIM